jgi:hypothetical protein
MAYRWQVSGLKQLQDKIKKAPKKVIEEMDREISATVFDITNEQKRRAPKDMGGGGGLISSINFYKNAPLDYTISASAPYAAYVEFGTGALVDVPSGLEDYAILFKGRGVKKVNLPARPYFFAPFFAEKEALKKRLEQIINEW